MSRMKFDRRAENKARIREEKEIIVNVKSSEVREGIYLFKGKISRNLLIRPMVSHTYLLDDGEEMTLFDPSCGKSISRRIKAHIKKRLKTGPGWKRAFIIAGHSHMDHANNFHLSDITRAGETRVHLHEAGIRQGQVKNEPYAFVKNMIDESKRYYNPYLSFFPPYSRLICCLYGVDLIRPAWAKKTFSFFGSLFFPKPVDGSIEPEPLRDREKQEIDIGNHKVKGWRLGDKIILHTPGHSSCSVSLFWPEKKALFISDAAWIGNPVFVSSSLKDCVASLKTMRSLVEAGRVDLLLPAHGTVKEGAEHVLDFLNFHIYRLKIMKSEVLAAQRAHGGKKGVRGLVKILTRESSLFRSMKLVNYPRSVVFVHNVVVSCLRDEGILR